LASRLAQSIHSTSRASLEKDAARLARIRTQLTPEEETLLLLRIDRRLSWDEVADVLAEERRGPDPAALRKRFERLKTKIGRRAKQIDSLDAPGPRPEHRTRGPGR
jgi:RNA polymerase sigma-70 factor (ECF subfamily)